MVHPRQGASDGEPEEIVTGRPAHPSSEGRSPVPDRLSRAARHNLPVALSSFVGRRREMARIEQLLGANRLLTLTGSGGSGKTRLALAVAAERLPEYADGAWLVNLAPLTDPDIVPEAVAVGLFAERARSRQPGFELTEENGRAVAEICERLDGIPLAIELAAARVKIMGVERLASRLDDSPRLLTEGSRTATPRRVFPRSGRRSRAGTEGAGGVAGALGEGARQP